MGGLLKLQSKNARTRALNELIKKGFNYFVCYRKGINYMLQYAVAKKRYVNKYGEKKIYIEGVC